MNDKIFKAALAGLLHDIGKFAQRAAEGTHIQWDDESKIEFKYQHALYTDGVVEQIVPTQWRENVRGAAGRHHRPTNHLERVVNLADHLSAGERSDSGDRQPKLLQSIFCSLDGVHDAQGKPIKPPQDKYLPLKKLAINAETIFPVAEKDDSHWTYEKLWADFLAEAKQLKAAHEPDGNGAVYLESLLNLMQQYTWSIPSAYYKSVPDISLYNHSRMTAALAACLVEQDPLPTPGSNQPAALLVGGDISGVQSFIYTIMSSGAAKSLRGRSFYLQLLTEAVANYVLKELGLPSTNLIYAGGGNFFLLAPLQVQETLKVVSRDVTEKLLAAHNGELHLILAQTTVTTVQFERKNFHLAWQQLHETLNRTKLQPLIDLPLETLAREIGSPAGEGGDTDRQCKICGREANPNESLKSDEDDNRICSLCQSFIDLGKSLPKATHFVTLHTEPRSHHNIPQWWMGLETFGINLRVVNADVPPPDKNGSYANPPLNLRFIEVATLKKSSCFAGKLQQELNAADGYLMEKFQLFAQLTPLDSRGNLKTFDQLAKESRGGFNRWGVLRMDVDNLGKLFEQGFSNPKTGNGLTISRLAQLSFNLRLFFEGWLPNLAETDANRLYIQYAGGDDLFVVGSWDALPPFAASVKRSFADFAAGHPGLTLSGGITLAAEKYPLYQAAREAESAESKAKNFIRADESKRPKDTLCFLDQVIPWEDFDDIYNRVEKLASWCGEDGPVSRALLQNLVSIYLEYKQGRAEALRDQGWDPDKPYFGPWMWHLAYQLARRREDKHTPNEVKDELVKIEDEILTSQKDIEAIGLAARWAQYLIRK